MKVSILAVRPFLDVVGALGVPPERFLAEAAIDPSRLADHTGSLDLEELDRVQAVAIALTGDPALGLHMAERATAPAYDAIGHIPAHAATLRETVELLLRFSRIHSDLTGVIEEQGDEASITFRFASPPGSAAVRLRAELAVTGFTRIIQEFCGPEAMPLEVSFEYAAPPHRQEYARLFGGRERFDQERTSIRFDRSWLDRGALHASPRLKAIFAEEAERTVTRLEQPNSHAERVRDWLRTLRAPEVPTMADAATALGISVRSLRRRLAEEDVTYPHLVDEVRVGRAKKLLDDTERSLYEIAFEMGFSDPSAFHRAFRRWTGMTPTQYRERSA